MILPLLLSLPTAAAIICAYPGGEPLKVTITSVSGRSVFLDRGRGAGITPGLRVHLYPPGSPGIEVIIADATTNSSRIDIPEGMELPPVGTPGDLDLPEPKPPEQIAEPAKPATPAHPPWTRKEEPRAADQPLLAPAYARPAKDRPMTIHGQIYSQLQLMLDRGGGRESTYELDRIGTRLNITNPFGQGGRIQFAGDFDRRAVTVQDGQGRSESNLTLDRLSYAIGGEQYSSYRAEGGRFISIYLPEIGLMDGVEGALLLESGLKIGAGIGAYPDSTPERRTGDEFGFHIFADFQPLGPEHLDAVIGYQKTWHKGGLDRDVLIGRISCMPTKELWLYGSAKVDVYTSDDTIKETGPQLTEAWAQARYTFSPRTGVSAAASHYTWPDTKLNEYRYIPPELIRTGRVDRFDLTGWQEIVKDVRLTGRGNYWTDQRGNGYGGEGDVDWDKAFDLPVAVHGAVFYDQASYNEGMGFRAEVRPSSGDIQWFAGYEFYQYRFTGLISDDGSRIRHTLRAGVGWQMGSWYYNLTADHYFGDSEDAFSLGAFIEYRF